MTLLDNRTKLINRLNTGEGFFFAGSGISYLSFMPSAGKILCKTADIFLPQDEEYKASREIVISNENDYHIQPELLYETLLYVLNSNDTLFLWRSLSPDYLKMFGYPVIPNINHLFIVDYSVKNNVPIFTTNFDCLFEEAAKELGYDYEVLLPHTNAEADAIQSIRNGTIKKGVAHIFKLHGSIYFHGFESLETLSTTMISITKVNFPVIDLLETISRSKHIIFVGYSGRDIDYFPEIKRRSLSYTPIWVDQFHDPATKENCEYINAIPVISYPNEIFEQEKPELKRSIPPISKGIAEEVFTSLQKELVKRIAVNEDEKRLLLGIFVKEIGDYKLAYRLLLGLYRNNSLTLEKQTILLLALSGLAHENSLYESCGSFAKEALRITRRKSYLESYAVRALFQISESKRMLIAHDAIFLYNMNYPDAFLALLSFLLVDLLVRGKVQKIRNGKVNNIADIYATQDLIEHRIRLFALVQAFVKPIIDRKEFILSKFLRTWLINRWHEIRRESFSEGHSHGIATAFRFETRINWDVDELKEGRHIFELRSYETGKGLILSNIAEDFFKSGHYADAKKFYLEFFDNGLKSGNKLNAIKGLLGIAKCNRALSIYPLLAPSDLRLLKELMRCIEGKNWQRYFSRVLKAIEH